jgi:sugar-specific transcriptional regulator TrmB
MSTEIPKLPFLERIGLSEDEQKVYVTLLALGPLTAGEISKYTGIKPISKIKSTIGALMERNYAYNIDGLVDKAIGLYPFKEIAEAAGNDSKKIDKLVAELKNYVAEMIAHFDQVMKDTEAHVRSEKKRSSDKVSQNSEENRQAIDTKLGESTATITETVDSTKKSITSAANSFLKKQTESVNTYETSTNENLDTFATELKEKTETTLTDMKDGIKTKNDEFLADGSSALNSTHSTISSKADSLAGTLKDDSKEKLDGTRDHVLTGLDNFVAESEGNVNSLNETLTSATNSQSASIKSTTEEAKKNRIDMNLQFKTGLADSFEKVKGDFAADLEEFKGKFSNKLSKIAKKFKSQIDDLTETTATDIGLLCEEATASVSDLVTKHNEEIAANVDLDNKAVEDGTTSMLSKVDEQNSKAIGIIDSSTQSLNSSITLLKANYSGDINVKVDETITSMHTTIDGAVQETKDEYNSAKTSIIGKLENLTTGNSDDSAAIAGQQTEEIKTSTDAQVTGAKEQLGVTKSALVSSVKKAKQKIASDSTGSVDTMGTTATTTLTETTSQAKTGIRNNEETTIGAIEEITGVVETSVRKEIEAVKGGFDDYYKRFAKDALKISQLLMDFKSQHETLLNAVVIYPRPKIETAILYSKDAVFHRLDDMLTERIKSNVTMVIPDPTDIPTKSIGKVKAQAKMTIVSKIDEVANKNIIDDIKAVDDLGRTKIRKIGMSDMVGFSEYIAFDRDGGEEMLIAFKDETEKDWVGILSTSDGFKNVVIGETLGRQAMSISRELK